MSEGTSIGKISLQVDLQGDMQKQISEMASGFGTAFKSALEKATKGMLTGVEKAIDNAMNGINTSIKQGLDKMEQQMAAFMKRLESITKKVKVPRQMPLAENIVPTTKTTIPTTKPRGPPAINSEAISAEIASVTRHLDLVNEKIRLQQEKLAGLKTSYERAFSPNIKNKLASQINTTELAIMRLTNSSDKMGFKLNDLDNKMNGTATTAQKMGASMKVAGDKIKQAASNSTKNISPLGKSADIIGSKFNRMGMFITQALRRVLIMATLYKVIRGFMSYMGSALATNQQFSNSLAQIKSNLQVAFIPIYIAILPALNAMMSAIAKATAYMASFLSIIFGSSFKASAKSAKALNAQKKAIAGVGGASKKAAKEIKKSLAGFDEINNLSTGADDAGAGGGGGGGASGPAPIIEPGIDMNKFETGLKNFLAKLDPYLEPARQALGRLKDAFEPLKQNIFAGLKWLLDNVLIPLGKWTITEVVPRFIDILAGAFYVLNEAIEALKPTFQFLWENMLKPLAEWTGGIILAVLDKIIDIFKAIGDWIKNNQTTFEALVTVVGAIAAAFVIVTGAIKIFFGILAGAKAAFGIAKIAFAAINGPIGVVILAIGALIGIGILLWKNWDVIKEKAIQIWNAIKETISKAMDNAKTTIKNIWEGIKTFLENLWNGFINTSKTIFNNVWNAIKNVFSSVGSWFKGIFDGAWNGIKNAFSNVTSFFAGIWTTIKNTFTTIGSVIGNGIADAFKLVVNSVIRFAENTINGFIRAINGAIGLINKIPGVNIAKVSTLSIPKLATGGMIEQPTLAMVGEAGKEAVVPLDRDKGAMQQIADMIMSKMDGGGGGGDYETTAEVDGDVLFKVVMKRLNKRRRQKGLPIIEY